VTYRKPEVSELGLARTVIEHLSTVKPPSSGLDGNRITRNAEAAYDLDE
jgi:hypothetical protein